MNIVHLVRVVTRLFSEVLQRHAAHEALGPAAECSVRLVPRRGEGKGPRSNNTNNTNNNNKGRSGGDASKPPPPFWVTGRLDHVSGREWYVCHHDAVPSAYVERAFGMGFGGVFG